MQQMAERATLVQQVALENGYFAARLAAPRAAARVMPGHRVTLSNETGASSAPLFVLRADRDAGWIEVLYSTVPPQHRALSQLPRASALALILDETATWNLPEPAGRVLVLADQPHLAPAVFLADTLRKQGLVRRCLILLELTDAAPFRPRPSHIMIEGMPAGVIAAMPLLEDWGVPSRLASREARPGCFEGSVSDLAKHWLNAWGEIPADLRLASAGIEEADLAQLAQWVNDVFPLATR